ncbi:hypothetical protein ACIQPR_46255 [Streptomyces sp. NPDC091280]|uniref:hypothetical protein n=1 Tax=Streptomyces sp. NPDC091280 TaxID=3365984 RepID=UPI003803170E
MSLHAQHLFTDLLDLPVHERRVVGNGCYAVITPDSPLRLRIDIAESVRVREYGGLRLTILHPDHGALDQKHLSFADHGTFAVRDARLGKRPGHDGYGVIRDWHHDDASPWIGAAVLPLSRAIQDYLTVWAPEPATAGSADCVRRRTARLETDPEPARRRWLTDVGFLARLHRATSIWLDIVDRALDDDLPLTEALTGSEHAAQLLGVPAQFGVLVEAEAAARIVHAAGLTPSVLRGTTVMQGLSHIATLPPEEQHRLVQAAARGREIDAPAGLPEQIRPAPTLQPPSARAR